MHFFFFVGLNSSFPLSKDFQHQQNGGRLSKFIYFFVAQTIHPFTWTWLFLNVYNQCEKSLELINYFIHLYIVLSYRYLLLRVIFEIFAFHGCVWHTKIHQGFAPTNIQYWTNWNQIYFCWNALMKSKRTINYFSGIL